ncbi:calsequestrin-1-like [Portunus trituberculatus]|uniref:calsequestrin-1-like n=1 Tax=Portunus trituberculatus TaxID=210409 RepID=UPI001E1D18F2|nr:calsequestrin-1-like [Portunus trituberculatus]
MHYSTILVLAGLAVLAAARPETSFSHETDDQHHGQNIDDDNTFIGSYRWMSPEGVEYFVNYVADEDGFRILESNAVPVSSAGVKADGLQGAFHSDELEDDLSADDDDSDDHDDHDDDDDDDDDDHILVL